MPDHPGEEKAKAAAAEVIQADTLLPGEKRAVESRYLDDAQIWFEVYSELTDMKHALLATAQQQRRSIRKEGRREVDNDAILLTREADRLLRRHAFWKAELKRRAASG